jgi:hypothetical protein
VVEAEAMAEAAGAGAVEVVAEDVAAAAVADGNLGSGFATKRQLHLSFKGK